MVWYQLLINQLGLKEKTATAIDHILTNSFIDTFFKTVILKTEISGHFPVCYLSQDSLPQENKDKITLKYKRTYKNEGIKSFNQKSCETEWNEIKIKNSNEAYKTFWEKFVPSYDKYFPGKKDKNKK